MLVDDDLGEAYENVYLQALAEKFLFPETWDVSENGSPTAEDLNQYKCVLWLTGDDRETTLTPADQIALKDYLTSSGKLFLAGQNIGFDLVADATAADSAFFADYLHAEYLADSSNKKIIYYAPGSSVTQGLFFYLADAGNQTAPSIIAPREGAQVVFNWMPGSVGAGISYEDARFQYQLIYLAFGLEGVDDGTPGMKAKLMANALFWFGLGNLTAIESSSTKPVAFELSQNYPNPFNHSTTIRYRLPQKVQVKIEVFNLLGRKVRTLVAEEQSPDFYEVRWNCTGDAGKPVSSGVYLYRIEAGEFRSTRKLLFLK